MMQTPPRVDSTGAEPTQEALIEHGLSLIAPTYAPRLVLARGQGARVWDVEGNEYLDFLAGIAVNVIGHAHPTFVRRVSEQVGRLGQISNLYFSQPQLRLAEALVDRTFADRVFFANSGAEANEAAMKLARRYQRKVAGTDRHEIVVMKESFHGRTFGALTATGQPKYHDGFEPLLPGFHYAEYNNLDSVADLVGEGTAAILVEPVQGEGGVIPGDPEFLSGLRALCDEQGALLIFDEVQTGVGRTGTLFAYEQLGVVPDILTTAKGLGGGIPIGAMLCRESVAHGFKVGSHATTFGGNPISSAAGLAVLEVIDEERLLERTRRLSARFREGLGGLSDRFSWLQPARGMGFMLGVPAERDVSGVMAASQSLGLLHNTAGGGRVLRFLPPLIVTEADVDEALNRLESALSRFA